MDIAPDLQIVIQFEDNCHSVRLPVDKSVLMGWGFSQEELLPFSEGRQRGCSKIVAWHETRNLADAYGDLLNQYGDRVSIFLTDSSRWLQLTSSEASKERALLELLSLQGIAREEVVVFGDDVPDVGMFKTFGYSVAMANAPTVLKDAATYVTRSNDDDGVAFAIDRYLGISR